MENTRNQCRECNGEGTPSKGIMNYHNRRKTGPEEFTTEIVNCIKCQDCGHSWVPTGGMKQQFTSVDKEKIEAFVNKFTDAGKAELFEAIYRLIPNHLKWDEVNNGHPFHVDIARAYNAGKQNQRAQYNDGEFISSTEYFNNEFMK